MEAGGGGGGGGRSGASEGPLRFECPEEFAASPFAPGPPLSLESLRSPSKQLVLIRAPANFSPESLEGHTVPLGGFRILKAPQTDGTQKVYHVQATPGDRGSSARLLVPSGHRDLLTCAPPFGSSLTLCERYGDPSANQPLFPVAARVAPQIPEGLKQRFVPFGGCLKRPPPAQESTEEPPRKKKKKKRTLERVGDPQEHPLVKQEESWANWGPEAISEGLVARVERAPEEGAGEEGLGMLSAPQQQPEQDPPPGSGLGAFSQESLSSIGAEGWGRRSKKRKKEKRKEVVAPPEAEPRLQGEPAALGGPAYLETEPGSEPGSLAQVKEEPELGLPKRKKKKKKREKAEEEQEAALLEPRPVKQELGGQGELEAASVPAGGGGGEGQRQEEASELRAEELSQKQQKKKKKKHKREEEASWKEEPASEQE